MPDFIVTDPVTGRKIKMTGDQAPTGDQIRAAFASLPPAEPEQIPSPVTAVAPGESTLAERFPDLPAGGDPREAILTVGSAALAEPVSGLAGIAGLISGGLVRGRGSPLKTAARFQKATQEALTIEPFTRRGAAGVEAVGEVAEVGLETARIPFAGIAGLAQLPFSGIEGAAETIRRVEEEGIGPTAGAAVLEATGSPALATLVDVIPTATATILGARNPFGRKPVVKPEPFKPTITTEGPPVSVGRPSLDQPIDITPPQVAVTPTVTAEKVVDVLRKGKPARLAEEVLPDLEIIESAQRLGVDLNPEHYATNAAFQDVARALKTRPGSALEKAERAALDEISLKADKLVEDIGGSVDKAAVSDDILLRTREVIDDLEVQANVAYKTVRETIPDIARVDTTAIKAHLDNVLEGLGGDKSLLTSSERQLLSLIKKGKDGTITYAALDRVRRDVGDGFNKRSGPFADNSDFILREVYGVLSDTQNSVAEAFGIGQLYADARALVSKRKGLEDDAVALFGRTAAGSIVPKMRAAGAGLTKGDVTALNKLMEALPEPRRAEVAATILGDLFAGGSRQGGALGTGFAKNWQALNRNVTAKNALFRHLPPGTAQRFDDIGRVISGIVKSNQKPLANPSGTAAGIIRALDDASLVTKVLDSTLAGGAAEVVGTTVGAPGVATAIRFGAKKAIEGRVVGSAKADALLASQEFKDAIGVAIEGNTTAANNIIQGSPRFKAWLTTVPEGTASNIARLGFIAWVTSQED